MKTAQNAEQIILFGSHARGDWVVDETTGYRSDYDLLVIVAQEGLARDSVITADLWQRLRAIGDGTPVSVIVHHVKEVNQEIRAGQYFFIDIVREGIVLFDAKRVFHPQGLTFTPRIKSPSTNEAQGPVALPMIAYCPSRRRPSCPWARTAR